MFDILFARTFIIVGGMLVITSITAKINRAFETASEMWMTFISSFVLLFAVMIFDDSYPLNLILVACFSAIIGWQIGPTIEHFGTRFKIRKYLKSNGVKLKRGQQISVEQRAEFQESFDLKNYQSEWQNTIFQAIFATALAVFCTAGIVFLTSIDFSFLGGFLFIALIMLVVMGLVNVFFFKSKLLSLLRAYIGAVIFTLYLLYDFDRLEKMKGDESWSTAIDIAINLYLDIINLFLDLLEILAEAD
jgi:FtsH-binding integral membrane protein